MTDQKARISRGLAAIIASVLSGSHQALNSLFLSAGAPEPIPEGSHAHKWRDWIVAAGRDPNVDNFAFIGALIEEFMDVPPLPPPAPPAGRPDPSDAVGTLFGAIADASYQSAQEQYQSYHERRKRLEDALAEEGLQYFRGGRIIPSGTMAEPTARSRGNQPASPAPPTSLDEVLMPVLKGLRRAMYPLTHRRKGLPTLAFDSEYDVQDLLHVLLRPSVKDIRPEEYTPSYAGKSARMDFLLPDHATVVELKFVRDVAHGRNIGQELQIDIGHYRQHPKCKRLWCVIFDPNHFLVNSDGLTNDLQGQHKQDDQSVDVKLLIL